MNARTLAPFVAGLVPALAFGWIAFPRLLYRSVEQPLPFSHRIHASDDTGLSCADCHSLREDGSFSGIPSLERCVSCHEEAAGDSEAEHRLVEDYVRKGREIPWLVYARQPDNVRFSHAIHLNRAAIPCERCHGDHASTDGLRPLETNRVSGYGRDVWGPSLLRTGGGAGRGMKMSDCESCHAERGHAHTACLACHR
jgi:menaquinone reductase, multiheme cytochrome c subunit